MNANVTKRFSHSLLAASIAAVVAVAGVQAHAAAAPGAAPEGAQPSPAHAAKAPGAKSGDTSAAAVPTIAHDAVANYPGWNDPDLMDLAVHSGRAALARIRHARAALDRGDLTAAREDLAAAGAYSASIRYMAPYTVVVNRFRNARHEVVGTTPNVVVDDMLPIYSGMEEMAAYDVNSSSTAKATKSAVHAKVNTPAKPAKTASASNPAEAASATPASRPTRLAQAAKPANAKVKDQVDELGANLDASTVYLPVRFVASHIATARHALDRDKPDLDAAKGALQDIMDSLVQSTVDLHMQPQQQSTAGTATGPKGTVQANPAKGANAAAQSG